MSQPWLVTHALRKTVRDGEHQAVILDAIDLAIKPGEHVALMGPSGSGKSTLLQIIGALDPHYEGDVQINGVPLRGQSDRQLAQLRNRAFGFIFQAYNLLPHLTVQDNVLLPARFAHAAPDPERARELVERVGLGNKAHRLPATLSGGERQRVAIARAVYMRPQVVLCDEPTGNLDRQTAAGIVRLFHDLVQEGTALLIATHDPDIAGAAQRTVRLNEGKLQ